MTTSDRPTLLERFGLHRPDLRAWALYDWANSAYYLVIITAVFPYFYQDVAAAGLDKDDATARFGLVTTVALAFVAVLAPILGAFADYLAAKKRMLAVTLTIGVLSTALMYFIQQGDWQLALTLFAIGNIGISLSFVFYDSLLPHIAAGEEVDRVSTAGYAIGYLGSGLLLIINLLWIQMPETFGMTDALTATRFTFLSVAVWWALFSIPLFLKVAEPPRLVEADERGATSVVKATFSRLWETLHDFRGNYKQAFLMLLAMLVYNDGIGTIIRMAAIYAATLGLPQGDTILAILLLQFIGIPFSFLFGMLAGRIGTKTSIFIGLAVYCVISVIAYNVTSSAEFFVLAILVGTVQGGTQALSRSLFATMIPKHKASEFFGFFSVFEKFAGMIGPLLFSMTVLFTGSVRGAAISVAVFFVVGAVILAFVKVEEGRREAREAEARLLGGAAS